MGIHAIVCTEDAQVLLSLAGIRTDWVRTPTAFQQAYTQASTDSSVAILAVSEHLLAQLSEHQRLGTQAVIVPLFLEPLPPQP